MAMLNDQFRDDEGKIDFLALGKEEYQYRMALIQGRLEKSERAKDAYEEALGRYSAYVSNGFKGGRPRKNSPDTRGGSASPAGCAAGKRIPPQEYTTAAGESAAPLECGPNGGSTASAGRSLTPRAGEVSDSPKVSESSDAANRCFAIPAEGSAARSLPPTTAELYDFAEAARLSEADAREWWELCTERGWKDRYGKPIRDWKKACERYCARRAINRMAKGET